MILNDRVIKNLVKSKQLIIEPFSENLVNPCSYNVRLGNEFIVYTATILNPFDYNDYEKFTVNNNDVLVVTPPWCSQKEPLKSLCAHLTAGGEIHVVNSPILGTTIEYIELPNHIAAQYQGRSSLGRLFLTSHQTAGWIDAGFKGRVTLEIVAFDKPVILKPGMQIGQLIFHKLQEEAEVGYCDKPNSKYKFQQTVTPSKPLQEE